MNVMQCLSVCVAEVGFILNVLNMKAVVGFWGVGRDVGEDLGNTHTFAFCPSTAALARVELHN